MDYANLGTSALSGMPLKKPCCDKCADSGGDCNDKAKAALVAGVRSDLLAATWFLDNRWAILAVAVAAGGCAFAVGSYFVNRNP